MAKVFNLNREHSADRAPSIIGQYRTKREALQAMAREFEGLSKCSTPHNKVRFTRDCGAMVFNPGVGFYTIELWVTREVEA